MAAAFPFSFDKNFSSDNRGQDSSSGANISSSSLKCDLCREKPNSLSELRTLSCLHTLCKKCFRTQGAECPLCGYQLIIGSSSSASGQQQIGNNSFVVSNRGMLPVQPAKTSTAATSSSSLVSSSTSGHSQSSQLSDAYVEQLTIDTSFLIGNLLETVSFEDTIALPQVRDGHHLIVVCGTANVVLFFCRHKTSAAQMCVHILPRLHQNSNSSNKEFSVVVRIIRHLRRRSAAPLRLQRRRRRCISIQNFIHNNLRRRKIRCNNFNNNNNKLSDYIIVLVPKASKQRRVAMTATNFYVSIAFKLIYAFV